ncbi:circularly permuted type 2 ATP-grasp protein [Ethanoligenens sp.]|uniref:circularly permuted type 2 ATP-grasp protein n=1 Tax=Ethanoligenens sp. TaxID=2099655 RepID=UPI0039ED5093
MDTQVLQEQAERVNRALDRYGVKFGVYKNGEFHEQLFPFDALPRVIRADQFDKLEKGLIQRVCALNLFLCDIYSKRCILRDGIIPQEFIYSAKGFLLPCQGIRPPQDVYSHISGIDLVEAPDGWYVLEDNLRVPSGASYPMIAREIVRRTNPAVFEEHSIYENRNYAKLLANMFSEVQCPGIVVVLTPGRYNSAFFEHAYLAEKTGATLAFPEDLEVTGDVVYYKSFNGGKQRVGAIYRRVSDEFLDPLLFDEHSVIGVPHLMEVYRKGNVSLINAPGNGVADDKGTYYFVPQMIRYYLGEEPILQNAPTYVPYYKHDLQYVLAHLKTLVVKDVSEAGGYGVVFGRDLSAAQLEDLRQAILSKPRRFIAQEIINFNDLGVFLNGKEVPRKADFRAFVVQGKDIRVWHSGLTRYALQAGSFVVNSSQGGGFKDTWVLSR